MKYKLVIKNQFWTNTTTEEYESLTEAAFEAGVYYNNGYDVKLFDDDGNEINLK